MAISQSNRYLPLKNTGQGGAAQNCVTLLAERELDAKPALTHDAPPLPSDTKAHTFAPSQSRIDAAALARTRTIVHSLSALSHVVETSMSLQVAVVPLLTLVALFFRVCLCRSVSHHYRPEHHLIAHTSSLTITRSGRAPPLSHGATLRLLVFRPSYPPSPTDSLASPHLFTSRASPLARSP